MEKRPLQFTKKYVIVDKCITEGREMQTVVSYLWCIDTGPQTFANFLLFFHFVII